MDVFSDEFLLDHPLDAIYAKIERASENFEKLKIEIAGYLNSQPPPYTIIGKLDEQSTNYTFRAIGKSQPPMRFPILAGEIIQHLRSCLDYLVVALAGANGQQALRQHQFPICRNQKNYEESCSRGYIKGVSDTAKAKIAAVQPYNHPNPNNYTLSAINDLNARDKHRLLLLVSVAAALGDKVGIGTSDGSIPVVKHIGSPNPVIVTNEGVEIFRVGLSKPCPGFFVKADFTSQIAFNRIGSAQVLDIVPTLSQIIAFTTYVVDQFADEFPARS